MYFSDSSMINIVFIQREKGGKYHEVCRHIAPFSPLPFSTISDVYCLLHMTLLQGSQDGFLPLAQLMALDP